MKREKITVGIVGHIDHGATIQAVAMAAIEKHVNVLIVEPPAIPLKAFDIEPMMITAMGPPKTGREKRRERRKKKRK